MRNRLYVVASLVVLLAMLLAGCGTKATPTPTTPPTKPTTAPSQPAQPTAAPIVKRGGTLKWARNAIPENFDMAWTEANADVWIMVNVFEPLVRVDRTGTAIEPALAESWTISDDGLVYTFKMRPGLKFHDGTDVTTEDVAYSLIRARDTGPWNWSLAIVDKVEAVDNTTVRITLKEKSSDFLAGLALFSNGIFPKKAFEAAGSPEEFFRKPIGTGPFMVADWVVGEYMVLKRNPSYWELGADGKPLPYLDEVRLIQVPEDSTRVLQVQSGEIDATDAIPFSQVASVKNDAGASLTLWPSTQTYYIFLNHTKPPFDDVKVRQALNYAIDRQALLDAVLYGNGEVAKSFMPKAGPCWNPNLQGFPFDLEKAKKLIAESKYPNGHKGAKLEVPSGRVIGRDQATILKEMWAKIGIEVEVNEIEGGLLGDKFRNATFEAISGYQWTNDVIDPAQQVAWFVVDPAIHSSWKNDRAIELTKKAAVELDPQKRCEMYYEVQQIFNDEAVAISLYHTPFTTFVRKDVKGFYQIPLGWLVFKETWLDR